MAETQLFENLSGPRFGKNVSYRRKKTSGRPAKRRQSGRKTGLVKHLIV